MTAPRRHLLPPNATALEKAVDQTAPNWDATAQAFPLPRQGTPEAVKPWLAAELQPLLRVVEHLAVAFDDLGCGDGEG